ncbi:TIR domain-containing protein [Amycolatopsis acidiphila]|uniref:TIR domain-containing protein n=1 Tax=Amycolatopsis acidiphila TaxID=715473 RepID=UPI001643C3E9|nr:TIR domain-containing protein [Amycolatopsis acidiphila]UIJ59571.1 TIR domain-containing protein [Amycolatopsis acidiphila]GHG80693.1 hypothetical protein GCM10017788_49890 [Amycolatopsis acidiphila]
MTDYEYDVAVSFAGEDREFVQNVVEGLKLNGVKVFYDQDEVATLWGENLVDFLEMIYSQKARYALLFTSRHYVDKKWPNYERQITQSRSLYQESPYILPIRIDDTPVPGLPPTISYLDAKSVGIDGIVRAVLEKVGSPQSDSKPKFDGRVPRDSRSMNILLTERPGGWEYLLYGAVLRERMDSLEGKYRDHLLEYAPRSGVHLEADAAFQKLKNNFTTLTGITDTFNRVLSPGAQEQAFGKPGEPGDPDRIIHLAERFCSVYEEFLDFAANLRSIDIENDYLRHAADIQARWVNQPIEVMRKFVDDYVRIADTITDRLASGEKGIELTLQITLDLDSSLTNELTETLRRYVRSR